MCPYAILAARILDLTDSMALDDIRFVKVVYVLQNFVLNVTLRIQLLVSQLNLILNYILGISRKVMDILSRLAFSPYSKSSALKDDLLMIVRKQVEAALKKLKYLMNKSLKFRLHLEKPNSKEWELSELFHSSKTFRLNIPIFPHSPSPECPDHNQPLLRKVNLKI